MLRIITFWASSFLCLASSLSLSSSIRASRSFCSALSRSIAYTKQLITLKNSKNLDQVRPSLIHFACIWVAPPQLFTAWQVEEYLTYLIFFCNIWYLLKFGYLFEIDYRHRTSYHKVQCSFSYYGIILLIYKLDERFYKVNSKPQTSLSARFLAFSSSLAIFLAPILPSGWAI